MDCVYINLDRAQDRRITLERSFHGCRRGNWELRRFRAIDAAYVQRHAIPGSLKANEKGCFLSHKFLIRGSLDNNRPIFVLEDDAVLGTRTCAQLEELVRLRDAAAWDLAFTDFIVPDLGSMVGLLKLRQRLAGAGQIKLLDLSTLPFAGSTAYLVNGRSKGRLAALLDSAQSLDVPYDLFLRNLIYAGKLKACGFFPFITSLSSLSDQSEIQPASKTGAVLVWNAFRRLAWVDRDLEREQPLLQAIASRLCDPESTAFGTIFAAMASREYRPL